MSQFVWQKVKWYPPLGIDAPETVGQTREAGMKATSHLVSLLRGGGGREDGGDVLIRAHKDEKGKWGRWMVKLWTVAGQNLNRQMIEDGHAVVYPE